MQIVQLQIPDVLILEPKIFTDQRGYFFESYSEAAFAKLGITDRFIQDNHSHSKRHVLRGLHYQVEHAQGKLVRVLQGRYLMSPSTSGLGRSRLASGPALPCPRKTAK